MQNGIIGKLVVTERMQERCKFEGRHIRLGIDAKAQIILSSDMAFNVADDVPSRSNAFGEFAKLDWL